MKPDSTKAVIEHISLRPVAMPGDEGFLRELYFTTRNDLAGVIADEGGMRALLLMQYAGQARTYSQEFPDASHDVIEVDGERVGRLIVDQRRDHIRCVDISLMPNARNRGIGTFILRRILDECSSKHLPCVLEVLKTNPARELYERLGFQITGDEGTHFQMKWQAHK